MALKAKKIDSNYTYSTVEITTSFVSKSVQEFVILFKHAQFYADMEAGLIILSDDVQEYQGDYAWKAIEDFTTAKDPSGRIVTRGATTIDGWHYQILSTEVTTGKVGGFYNKDYDGNDLGFVTYKTYNASNVEITDAAYESEAVKTEIWIRPAHSYEIIGGIFSQNSVPESDVRFWVIGLPGVANIKFTTGGINLKHCGTGVIKIVDGRSSKYLQYVSQVPDANSFKLVLKHNAGVQHNFQLHLEMYRAV